MNAAQGQVSVTRAMAYPKLNFLRFVLALAALGHLVVGLTFWFAPELAVEEILAWGPASGWTTILGSYDLSVAFALFLAFRDPIRNAGIVKFVGVLLVLHALTHAYYTVIGDSPARFWFVIAYLLAGGVVMLALAPRSTHALGSASSFRD